ncbi:MAG: MATE family efflux transporter [Geodermatophilaceae bacterium]
MTAQRGVLALAAPALVVLAAEPLYLLIDTAVVGHLGSIPLAALALGGGAFAFTAFQFNFLAYGTTSVAARRFGAGDVEGARGQGVQASYLAIGIGLAMILLFQLLADPITRLLAGGAGTVQAQAELWLRIASLGAPMVLLTLAGNGWMRGVQDTRRPLRYALVANIVSAILCPLLVYPAGLGLAGSAVANVVGQSLGAALFVAALVHDTDRRRPDRAVLRAQVVMGRDLAIRTLVLQGSFLVAAGVAARIGTAQVGAHQIALQLWFFLALALDSFAIAAQSLVGESLGASRLEQARATAWKVARYGAVTGVVVAVLLLLGRDAIPRLFTSDPEVLAGTQTIWWWFALMQPLAGLVFALDGVLMGSGDVAFLRTLTLSAGLLGFLPLTLLSIPLGLGLTGIWAGLTALIVIRLIGGCLRIRGGRWAVGGVEAR